MKIDYRNFSIMENKLRFSYKDEKWEETNFVICQEHDGEIYYMTGVTAFDSVEEAKQCIDEFYERSKNYVL